MRPGAGRPYPGEEEDQETGTGRDGTQVIYNGAVL